RDAKFFRPLEIFEMPERSVGHENFRLCQVLPGSRASRCPLRVVADVSARPLAGPLWATRRRHSITSSAIASNVAGIDGPDDLLALRLTMRLNFLGCSTGTSSGRVGTNAEMTSRLNDVSEGANRRHRRLKSEAANHASLASDATQ